MRIKAEDTFAIVIDYQEKILPAMSGQEELLRKSQIFMDILPHVSFHAAAIAA